MTSKEKLNNSFIFTNDVEKTKIYIDNGVDVNAKTIRGDTALILATSAEKTKLLIESGADINVRNIDGFTALMM